jgi:ribosome-associated toxin RatA of RatAB toxin-antitoxin module
VETVEASTLVYLSPEEVYDFLVDFRHFEDYSKYVTDISREGDGTLSEYEITVSWWKIGYTARTGVTDVDPPDRIDWELVQSIDAHGYWRIEHVPDEAPDDQPDATRVLLHAEFDPETVTAQSLDLPRLIPVSKIVDKVAPKTRAAARIIIGRILADLEGEKRSIDLTVHESPDPDAI